MTSWLRAERPAGKILAQLVSQVGTRAILLGATVGIAHAVGVANYGLFAVALIFYQAGLLLRDGGLAQASIILGARDSSMTWAAFVAASAIGTLLAVLMAVVSGPATALLRVPDAAPFVGLLALAFGLGSLGIASNAALEGDLRFTARAAIELASYVALGGVTFAGVVLGWGAMALAWGYVAQGAVQAGLAILLRPPWRDRTRGTTRLGALVRYGGVLWASALLTYVATNVDNLSVAALGGARAIGEYALSYTVGTMIAISFAQVLNRVALPYYARAADPGARMQIFATVVPLSTALAILAASPVIALAPELRDNLLGSSASAAPLALLAAYGIVRAAGIALGTALNGSGLARPVAQTAGVNVLLLLALLIPAFGLAGPTGVAVVVLGAMIASIGILAAMTRRHRPPLGSMAVPGIGVAALVLLSTGPLSPAPLSVRMIAGLGLAALAAVWAWRLMRAEAFPALTAAEGS